MSEIIEIPIAVINTLQARIAQLESALTYQSEATLQANRDAIVAGLRRLRLHGVIPLFVARGGMNTLQHEVERSSPELIKAIGEVWPLETGVLSEATKKEIQDKANNGMDRWS